MARRRVLLALGTGIALAVALTAAFLGSRAPAAKPAASPPKLPRRQPESRTTDAIHTGKCRADFSDPADSLFPAGEWWAVKDQWTILLHRAGNVARIAFSNRVEDRVVDVRVSVDYGPTIDFSGSHWRVSKYHRTAGTVDELVIEAIDGGVLAAAVPFELYYACYQDVGRGTREVEFPRLRRLLEQRPVFAPLNASDGPADLAAQREVPWRVVEWFTRTRPGWRFLVQEVEEMPPGVSGVVDRVVRQEWRTQGGWLRTTFELCLSPRAAQERMRAVFLMEEHPIVPLASPREAFKIDGTTVLRRGALYWEVEGTAPVVDALVEFMDGAAPE